MAAYRVYKVLFVVVLSFVFGCDSDDPTSPVVVDTDYDFVVVNNTGTDFEVFRRSSSTGGEWEAMAPIGAGEGVPYSSEVGFSYLMRFCLPGEGPEQWQAGVNYSFSSTNTEYWVLDDEDLVD